MIPTIDVTFNLQPWIDTLETVQVRVPQVLASALNRAGDASATVLGRELAQASGLPVGKVRDEMEIGHATPGNLEYLITVSGRHMTLKEFAPRQLKAGISARPWGMRRVFPYSFLINDIPFIREGADRLPIRPLYGPSLGREVTRGNVLAAARQRFRDVMPVRLAHEVLRQGGGD